jgi:Rrf2 family protein
MKAMLALGRRFRTGPIMIGTLAREESIPIKFLEAILLELKGRGILTSKLGRKGGYQLSRPPSTVTIGSLIRIMEGPLAPLPCASETAYKPCEECADIEHCGTRIIMRRVRDAMSEVLDRTTLADLLRATESEEPAGKDVVEALMYHI